jgi:hypothetical protein
MPAKKIDGYEFHCDPARGRASLRMLAKLGAKLGPAFAALGERLKGVKALKSLSEMEVSALGAAVAAALASLSDPEATVDIAMALLERTEAIKDGRKFDLSTEAAFDELFSAGAGGLPLMFKACAFAMEVNYGGFFGMFRALVGSSPATEGGS